VRGVRAVCAVAKRETKEGCVGGRGHACACGRAICVWVGVSAVAEFMRPGPTVSGALADAPICFQISQHA
jgi:hypothetical protein